MAGIAEAATSSVVSFAADKLLTTLVGTISSISGVHGQVEEIKRELERIQSTMIYADRMQTRGKNQDLHFWMLDMRDVAFELEDIIVTFNIEEAKLREERSCLKMGAFIIKRWAHLYNISKKIRLLQPKLKEINARREENLIKKVGGGEGSSSCSSTIDHIHPLRWVLPNAEDEYVIGLEDTTRRLVEELLKEDDERRVVSIVGMAGSGKTTLAKHTYIRNDIKSHFDCYAWADVSKECNVTSVLRDVRRGLGIEEGKGAREEDNEKQLMEKINNFLRNKCYLVVLDDVWTRDDWTRLSKAFPVKGKKGSKVLLTSRDKSLASCADPSSQSIEPTMLTTEESWTLLCKQAFGKLDCPSKDLEDCGRKMVGKCGGLPLAIVVLGGILSTKSSLEEWEVVRKNIKWHLGVEEPLSSIIALSYDELSYHLKSCFLYFSLLPEDYRFKARRLIRLWIAEGFVHKSGNESFEETAEKYLKELIGRGMVQVAEMSPTIAGRVKVCRVHDVLRDFSMEKAKEADFGDTLVFDKNSSSSSLSKVKSSCRLAIHLSNLGFIVSKNQHHRSLLLFGRPPFPIFETSIIKYYKLLRVLHLENIHLFNRLPREIGKLIHLRYLRMTPIDTWNCFVPSSIGNLCMLQTLRFGSLRSQVWIIPNVLWKMEELRDLSFSYGTPTRHLRIDNLKNLQSLKGVETGSWMKSFGNFADLVKLGIRARRVEVNEVCCFVAKLRTLHSLSLVMEEEIDTDENTMMSPTLAPLQECQKLQRLMIMGPFMKALPNNHLHNNQQFPPHLTTLQLNRTKLEEDPMPILEKLHNLLNLQLLRKSYQGRSMVCKAKGFPRLQFLIIAQLPELVEWMVEEGAMPNLRRLYLSYCPRLGIVPDGLKFLTALHELKLKGMSSSFFDRIKDTSGEDWCKVQHIPSVVLIEE